LQSLAPEDRKFYGETKWGEYCVEVFAGGKREWGGEGVRLAASNSLARLEGGRGGNRGILVEKTQRKGGDGSNWLPDQEEALQQTRETGD